MQYDIKLICFKFSILLKLIIKILFCFLYNILKQKKMIAKLLIIPSFYLCKIVTEAI